MLFKAKKLWPLLGLIAASPSLAQPIPVVPAPVQSLPGPPALETRPDHVRRYNECMQLARMEPLRALPAAEKWIVEGGGMGARHCVAVAMFQSGKHAQAAAQFEAIARDMGQDRPGLRAELYAQAGQAWMESGAAERAAAAQSRALELKTNDPDLWVDRGLSYAAMQSWPRAISDFDQAIRLRQDDVEVLVLRAAAWRNARDPGRALVDVNRALSISPDNSEALLERGMIHLARGSRDAANADFNRVLKLAPASSPAARRAEAGLAGGAPAAAPPAAPVGGKR